ncbi:hypothetical protein ACFC3F_04535 [Microbacterium sp. NPDC055910]|uniref:hypothetical protein n=1 Tax=Microbacterium sp. NPDC055910 TaxID=3345659 RepID=UPI0035DAC1B4
MTAPIHYLAPGTSRPACGDTSPDAPVTSSVTLVTCTACARVVTTPRRPTPHGRTN